MAPWNKVDKLKKLFCLNQLIFVLQTSLEEISHLSEKEKPLFN